MKQLLPKLKKVNCQKLISKKKSQIDRATLPIFSKCYFNFLIPYSTWIIEQEIIKQEHAPSLTLMPQHN